MLSAGEINGPADRKPVTGNVFQDAMELPPLEEVKELEHVKVDSLDIIECEKCPPVVDQFFSNVHEPRFFDCKKDYCPAELEGTTWVEYFQPGQYDKIKKWAGTISNNSNAGEEEKKTAKRILAMYSLPADPEKANEYLRRMLARPDLFTFVDMDVSIEVGEDGIAKQVGRPKQKPLRVGRSEDNKNIYVFEKDKILDKPCPGNKAGLFNTLRGAGLTDVEIRKLVLLLDLNQNDYCIDKGWNGPPALAVAKDISVDLIDGPLTQLIVQPGLFAPERAPVIAAALKKAFEESRERKGTITWQKVVGASSVLVGAATGIMFYKMYRLNKKAHEGKMEMKVGDFIKDNTERLKAETPKLIMVPEVQEMLRQAKAALIDKHVVFVGRTGSGKDLFAQHVQRLALTGQISIPQKVPRKAVKIDSVTMGAKAAFFQGAPKAVGAAVNKAWLEGPGLYHIPEWQIWLTISERSGAGPDATSTNAMDLTLTTLEIEDPNFRVVASSSKGKEILAGNPDTERRVEFIPVPDFSPSSLHQMLNELSPDYFQKYGIKNVDPGLFSKIIAATKFLKQSPNSGVDNILKTLCKDAAGENRDHIGTKEIALWTKNKAAILEINLSIESAEKALEFIERYPSIEPERAQVAAQLIEYGKDPELVFAEQHELARTLEEGRREMARRSNGGSRRPPGGAPPSTSGSGGAGGAAPAGSSGGGSASGTNASAPSSQAHRTSLTERIAPRVRGVFEEVGGALPLFGLFAGITTLRHNKIISESQEGALNTTMLGIFAYFSPVALIGAWPGAGMGYAIGEWAAKVTGLQSHLPKWIPAKEIAGIAGGFAGFAAAEKFNQRFAWYRKFSETSRRLVQDGVQHAARTARARIGAVGEVIEEGIVQTARNTAAGLRTTAQWVVQTARQAAPLVQRAAQQLRNAAPAAPAAPLMIAPAGAALKGVAATATTAAAAGTALVAGGILAVGAGGAYMAVKTRAGEKLADAAYNTLPGRWVSQKIYEWFLD